MITKRFIKSSIIYTIAGALPMASALLLLPFYIDLLSVQQYGSLALYLAFSIFVQIIVTYSFDASLYLHFHDYKDRPDTLARFVGSSFTFILLLGFAVVVLVTIIGVFVLPHLVDGQTVQFFPFGFMACITGVFQSLFKVNNTFLQSREKPEMFLVSNLLSFTLVAAFSIAGLYVWPHHLGGPVGGRMLAFLISAIWVLVQIYREFGFQFDFSLIRTTLVYNTYQSIYQLQTWVINYFDRFLMALMITMSDLGVYDFTIKCLLILDLIISGIFNSFFPKILSQSAKQNIRSTTVEINRYYHGLTAIIMLMVSGTILVLPVLISLWKTEYLVAAQLVPFASLVFLLRGLRFYFGLPYNTMKESKPLPIIFLMVAGSKVLISWWLISLFGVKGAIAATLITSVVEIILLWIWMRNRFVYKPNVFKLIACPMILMLVILLTESMAPNWIGWEIHTAYVLLTLGLLGWFYRKEIILFDFRNLPTSKS